MAAGFTEHPAADAHDGAGLLGDIDEAVGGEEPVPRMLPAQQRLSSGDRALGDAHLRLVEQAQLAALNRAAELALEREALLGMYAHLTRVEAQAVAPFLLGAVERDVGVAHERRHIAPVGRGEGEADTHREGELARIELERGETGAAEYHVGVALDFEETNTPENYYSFAKNHPDIPSAWSYEEKRIHDLTDASQELNVTRTLVTAGFSDEEVRKILGGNFLRVFREVWGA